jgi:hypothetical protein
MTDDTKPMDRKAAQIAFNELLRDSRNVNRVTWTPSTSLDPEVRRADRDALNDALRRAGSHKAQHETDDPEPQTFPWKSLGPPDEAA